MIDLEPLRLLQVAAAPDLMPDRLSAASGIVVAGECLYVIADDELHLGVFALVGTGPGRWVRMFPGALPDEASGRKARKPDLEALLRLPPFAGHREGALLALASGSKPNRATGVLLALDAAGGLRGTARAVDLSALYATLHEEFPALNIEGAVVRGRRLVLLQRASGGHPRNALIGFALDAVLDALGAAGALSLPALPATIITVELGRIDGVALGFTDAAALPDGRIAFSAVAEGVDDTYHDGPCVGAAIGVLGADGRVQFLQQVRPVRKIEGIHARVVGTAVALLLTSDADDRGAPGALFAARIDLRDAS